MLFVLLESETPLHEPACEWLGHTYPLYKVEEGYRAALPVDRLQKVGPSSLVVRAAGRPEPLATRTVLIVPLDTGPVQIIRLTPETMALQKDPRLEEESKRIRALLATRTLEPLWKGAFKPPSASGGHNFGKRRRYIEIRKGGRRGSSFDGYHRGLDFSLAPGTPVPAANAGKVLAAEPFVLSGNTVLVDHGQGLITGYFHLSEFKVKAGDLVGKGDIVGLVGSTGRSTGPHLHWSVYVQGQSVNPVAITQWPAWFLP